MAQHPVLWTFRRCPYAMRARLALQSSGVMVELREILLRDKPQVFLEASPSATVPLLCLPDQVIDESLDIMVWTLKRNDPEGLLGMPSDGWDLIAINDGPFKQALDHTKYAVRYPDLDPIAERAKAAAVLMELDARLKGQQWLFASRPALADYAILPFVRQFANTDLQWFDAQDWPNLRDWLLRFVDGDAFGSIKRRYHPWSKNDPPIWFGHAHGS